MNLSNIKKIVEKWIQGSGEKQLKVFTKSNKSRKIFNKLANNTKSSLK